MPCAGPLANDMDALEIFVKAVLNARPALYDSTALDVPWRDVSGQFKTKLRLGVLAEEATYPLEPSVRKAIDEVATLLQANGHEIVRLSAEECRTEEAAQVATALFMLDGTAGRLIQEGGETPIPSVNRIVGEMGRLPRNFVSDLDHTEGLERLSKLSIKRASISESWRTLWTKHKLDAVISPAACGTAPKHDQWSSAPYTVILNLLDVSSVWCRLF